MDGVCLPSEAAKWTGVPCPPPPCPRLPLAIASHLGGSGSSRPDAWSCSTPFPDPGRSGYPGGMGSPSRRNRGGRRSFQGLAGEGRGIREGAVQTLLLSPSRPHPPAGPLPHRLGLEGCQEIAEAEYQRPPGQAAEGGGPSQAHGGQSASLPDGWRPGNKVGGLDVRGSGGSCLLSPEAGTGLRPKCPRGPERPGLAWPPGLQRQAQEVGVELAGHGAGTGSSGS